MKTYDVIIIGGGPSGLITGVTAQKQNPQTSFLMIKEEENGLVPCGIPYVFHDLDSISQNKMGPAPFIKAGGEVLVDRVTDIDLASNTLRTQSGVELAYRKLVFATGSTPTVPTFIKGYDLENVETIRKSFNYITALKERVASAKNVVIIGGGFIGAEVAEQIAKHPDKKVTIVEMMDHCLGQAFSPDFAALADVNLKKAGVNVLTGSTVEELVGEDGKVQSVKLKSGKIIDADMVISAIGYKPNTDLAKRAGLQITKRGTIRVDKFMRTSSKNIYAVGDCSQTIGFITGRTDHIMLASTATAEARILGYNLSKIGILRTFSGTLSVFSTELNGYAFASAGAIEQSAEASDVEYVTGSFSDMDRHPGTLPGAKEIRMKIIVSPRNGEIIGGEIYGGKSIGEMINIIALAIQKYITVYELVSFQVGTHPLLTTAPTKYSLIKACEDAISKINCNHG
ncbi:MAG: FAD-dependent oxidoreductase [Candidatus Fermentibacteraceae bacterium]|nr:FAD-dependent oxidoreductase [Candidatus Fermentibacteraceae bacterium]